MWKFLQYTHWFVESDSVGRWSRWFLSLHKPASQQLVLCTPSLAHHEYTEPLQNTNPSVFVGGVYWKSEVYTVNRNGEIIEMHTVFFFVFVFYACSLQTSQEYIAYGWYNKKKVWKVCLKEATTIEFNTRKQKGRKNLVKLFIYFIKKEMAENHQATDTFKHLISLRYIKVSVY